VINRARAIENMCFVVASNQAASLKYYPPYSWSGGSMIVDFEGRVLAKASEGAGEKIVVAPIDVSALRHERAARRGHHLLAHLRSEAYPVYRNHFYPPQTNNEPEAESSYERNNELIDEAKRGL
jgi:formamidase